MKAALADAPLVTLYKQYVVRFGLGYSEEMRTDVQVAGYTEPVRMRATPRPSVWILIGSSQVAWAYEVLVVDKYD